MSGGAGYWRRLAAQARRHVADAVVAPRRPTHPIAAFHEDLVAEEGFVDQASSQSDAPAAAPGVAAVTARGAAGHAGGPSPAQAIVDGPTRPPVAPRRDASEPAPAADLEPAGAPPKTAPRVTPARVTPARDAISVVPAVTPRPAETPAWPALPIRPAAPAGRSEPASDEGGMGARGEPAPLAPDVHIHIGRVELTTLTAPPPLRERQRETRPPLPLDEYLRGKRPR